MVYIVFICFAAPLVLMLPLLRGQARWLVGFMLIGATVAVSAAEVNGFLHSQMGIAPVAISLSVAPVLEEIMKAVPVLVFAVLVSDKRRDVLPLAMSVGIGFAIMENAYLLVTNAEAVSLGWALVRGLATSLSHGMCTLAVGYGILFVRTRKKLFYTGTFALLAVAITFHATFNLLMLSPSPYDWVGLVMPFAVYAVGQGVFWARSRRAKRVASPEA